MAKDKINKKKVDKIWNSWKRQDLLEDRSEYDVEDLQKAYPVLNKSEAKLLWLRLMKWRRS